MKKEVVELCPHCENEVVMEWNTDMDGFKAFCPHCGNRLMLCDECQHRCDSKYCADCDYDSATDSCRFNPAQPSKPSLTTDEVESHEEKYILAGCLALMWTLVNQFGEWLDYVADSNGLISLRDKTDPETGFCFSLPYSDIVCGLFLWHTSHSGGTSTDAKCRMLGVDSAKTISFCFDDSDGGEDNG